MKHLAERLRGLYRVSKEKVDILRNYQSNEYFTSKRREQWLLLSLILNNVRRLHTMLVSVLDGNFSFEAVVVWSVHDT